MSVADAKLDKFSAAVLKDAQEHRSKILEEVENYRKAETDKAEEEILHEAYVLIQNEITSIRNDHTREVSRAELEGRRDLLLYRETLTKKVFDEVSNKLSDFTKTEDYLKYMSELIKKSLENLPDGDVTIAVKPADIALKDKLLAGLTRDVKFIENKSINLGGFILSNANAGVEIDETLDVKLKNQNDWFAAKSGLSIDM